ncbi:MAG TPA: hypothetical protein DD400_02315 [Rhodospirillaceae bacterium]|nr:hypothetical protein [Rhodospirillaceae bacterium]
MNKKNNVIPLRVKKKVVPPHLIRKANSMLASTFIIAAIECNARFKDCGYVKGSNIKAVFEFNGRPDKAFIFDPKNVPEEKHIRQGFQGEETLIQFNQQTSRPRRNNGKKGRKFSPRSAMGCNS